jgi:hypothetical protein
MWCHFLYEIDIVRGPLVTMFSYDGSVIQFDTIAVSGPYDIVGGGGFEGGNGGFSGTGSSGIAGTMDRLTKANHAV